MILNKKICIVKCNFCRLTDEAFRASEEEGGGQGESQNCGQTKVSLRDVGLLYGSRLTNETVVTYTNIVLCFHERIRTSDWKERWSTKRIKIRRKRRTIFVQLQTVYSSSLYAYTIYTLIHTATASFAVQIRNALSGAYTEGGQGGHVPLRNCHAEIFLSE